jgi:hypothetical protein
MKVGDRTPVVEFSDDAGKAHSIVSCSHRGLRVVSGAPD